ncbi:MAG: type 11 methyltransferase [Parcubacteria group bacterium Gr01-1014_2]|nr:MAG: type 11 methyltransferase [Parcubacteria group bacterium Gr01-1014_2]
MENVLVGLDLSSKLTNQTFDLKNIISQFGLEPGMKIADLGSGSGYFTVEMAKMIGDGGVVTAVDVLESALETVRVRGVSADVKNIHIVRANLEVLGSTFLSDNSQEFVLIKNVLFQNDQKIRVIREAKRILMPSKKMVIIDWEKGTGGLGPPDEYRTPKEIILSLASSEDLVYEKDIVIDVYHFGMMFHK